MNSPDTTYTTFEVSMIEDVKPEPNYLEEILYTETPQNLDEIQDQSWERTDKIDWTEAAINILETQVQKLSPQLGTFFGLKTKQEMWSVISTILCNEGHMYTSKQVQNKFYYLERQHKKPDMKTRKSWLYNSEPTELTEDRASVQTEVVCKSQDNLDWSDQESQDSYDNDEMQTLTSEKPDKQFWSEEPTKIMLSLMKELLPQVGTSFELKTKKKMFDVISKKLFAEGYIYTGQQVDTRITSMERRYKKMKRLKGLEKPWAYESDIAELLDERKRKQIDLDRGLQTDVQYQNGTKNSHATRTSQQQQHKDRSIRLTIDSEYQNDQGQYAAMNPNDESTPNFQGVFLPLQEQDGAGKSKVNSPCSEQNDLQELNVKLPPTNNRISPSNITNKEDLSTSTKPKDPFIATNVESVASAGSCGTQCIAASKAINVKLKRKMAMLSKKYDALAKSNKEFEEKVFNYLEKKEERAKRKEQRAEREEARKKRKLELFEKLVDKFCV